MGSVNVHYLHADLHFGKIAPADDSLPRHLVPSGSKIEEQINWALGELESGVNAKAAASKSDEAAGESCCETFKVS